MLSISYPFMRLDYRLLTKACNYALWSGVPLLVAFSSLAVAAVTSSKPLTSDIIFPAISLFMLLQFPLVMVSRITIYGRNLHIFPQISQVISNVIEAIVSIKRLSSFFVADEFQKDARKLFEKSSLRIGDEVLGFP